MKSVKRSITIAGHATSLSLEEPFWEALKRIAAGRRQSIAGLVGEIDQQRALDPDQPSLFSTLRVFVLNQHQG